MTEPTGKKKASSVSTLRFVIQRHDATRLHYNFRLDLYGDFEGSIPEGRNGGGTVQQWDRGYWIPKGDPHNGLKRGDLKFSAEGDCG